MSNKLKIIPPQNSSTNPDQAHAEKLAKYNTATKKTFSKAFKFGSSIALLHLVMALSDNAYYIRQPLTEHFADSFIFAIIMIFVSYLFLLLKAAHKHGVLVKGSHKFSSTENFSPHSASEFNSSSVNPTTGLPMCNSTIDVSGTPYCGSR